MQIKIEIRPFGNYCSKNCDYCYQSNRNVLRKINPELMIDFITKIEELHFGESIEIVFHGGEPLHDNGIFVNQLIELIEVSLKYRRIYFGIHTNGMKKPVNALTSKSNVNWAISVDQDPKTHIRLIKNKSAFNSALTIYQMVIVDTFCDETKKYIEFLNQYGITIGKFIPFFTNEQSFKALKENYSLIGQYVIESGSLAEPFYQLISNHNLLGCQFSGKGCLIKNNENFTLCLDNDGEVYYCNRYAALRQEPLFCHSFNTSTQDIYRFISGCSNYSCANSSYCRIFKKGLCTNGGCPFTQKYFNRIYDSTKTIPYYCESINTLTL